ncbi:class I SAM-dependent methyltransferase [Streptomyces sp. A3M-1-3]|uniref:class I SAM-dependent methyltransferase n=1 Tax=Streptomyces sp. A3M-1-3 TaxID=2962044 RepID=UPI0020B8D558|nr:class I SAM-dependent methyltransferase [Streptomyces sp. A3M-1-3]MCP3819172.1 class I SAM-dependent methyltransferase [Streptomyces sp. A3M-1-3]
MEIGCGGGVAVELICPLLSTGSITAIDRSATMTARALERNADGIRTGRSNVVTSAFSAAGLAAAGIGSQRFDKIFAINVNLFWTGPARDELALARDRLAPEGVLWLFYEPPPGRRGDEIIGEAADVLDKGGFATQVVQSASRFGERPDPSQ